MVLERGDSYTIGECRVIEADVDALALIDEARRHGAGELVLVGPRHREGRSPGLYERLVTPGPRDRSVEELVLDITASLTGSLKLAHVEAALRALYDKPFRVVECEARGEDCRGLLEEWLRRTCGAPRGPA